ncbi:MAG: RnfH family protein [Nitrosospira sp.]|nr:RnfH family protein [Nitrosospira sp.]
MDVPDRKIQVEVVYALPENQIMRQFYVPSHTTIEHAVELSGIPGLFPEIDLSRNKLGIFGKVVKPGTALRENDRIEIYRPLVADPKESRRMRAKESRNVPKSEV